MRQGPLPQVLSDFSVFGSLRRAAGTHLSIFASLSPSRRSADSQTVHECTLRWYIQSQEIMAALTKLYRVFGGGGRGLMLL